MKRAYVFANGEMSEAAPDARPGPEDLVIAADGGGRHALRWGFPIHVLLGDMDSLSPEECQAITATGAETIRHPVHKNQTDLELAVREAAERGAGEVIIYGALGRRWDMTLANVLLMTLPAFAGLTIRLVDGDVEILNLKGPGRLTIEGAPGDMMSLMPVGGQAIGVSLQGFAYPLDRALLPLGTTHGISNRLVASSGDVVIEKGILLIVVTHGESASAP